jgi:hypothetical protein
MRITRDLRYITELEAEVERLRFMVLSLGAFVFALILAIAVVK